MYKRRKISKLGRKTSHRNLMVRGQILSLVKYGHVTTTTSKARVLVQGTEKVLSIIQANEGYELNRRLAQYKLDREIITKFVQYVKASRPTVTIVKIGYRPGDDAQKSLVKITGWKEEVKKKVAKVTKKKETKVATDSKSNIKSNVTKTAVKISKVFTENKERSRSRSGL